jgi:triacylglycerol esterase/lipase EstA (alpha/beta hydrolase family)
VVIGHSVGGVVAKSLLMSGDAASADAVSPAAIQVIITLATPHTPVLLMDAQAHNFYDKVGFSFSPCFLVLLRLVCLDG